MLSLGENVYLWRVKRHWTQHELARKAGVPQPNLSNLEKGKADVTVSTLRRLAAALGVQASELLEGAATGERTHRVLTTRGFLEKVAQGVVGPSTNLSRTEKQMARLFRSVIWSQKSSRLSQKKVVQAWIELRTSLSHEAIETVLSKIGKARQRMP